MTGGQDALGEASVVVELGGHTGAGQAVATDIIEAAGIAYVRALTSAVRRERLLPEDASVAEPVATP